MSVPDLERLLGRDDEAEAAANNSRSGLNGLLRRLMTLLQGLTVTVNASDIEIGAVELKDGTTDTRGVIDADGLDVDVTKLPALAAGTAVIGKVGIDQTTPGT